MIAVAAVLLLFRFSPAILYDGVHRHCEAEAEAISFKILFKIPSPQAIRQF